MTFDKFEEADRAAMMTSTLASTNSRAKRGSSLGRPSAKRYSTMTPLPSTYPSSLRRFWKTVGVRISFDPLLAILEVEGEQNLQVL
jgi:hypothetical protein